MLVWGCSITPLLSVMVEEDEVDDLWIINCVWLMFKTSKIVIICYGLLGLC